MTQEQRQKLIFELKTITNSMNRIIQLLDEKTEEDDKEFHFSKERKIVKKYYRCPNCCNRIRYPHGLCSKCQNEIVTPNGDRIPWDETDGRDNDRLITNDRFLWTTEDDQNKNQFAVNRIPWKIEDDDTTELNIGHIGIDTFNALNVLSFNRSSL